jgi:hypothetical protein
LNTQTEKDTEARSVPEDQVVAEEKLTDAKVRVERWRKTIVLFLNPPGFSACPTHSLCGYEFAGPHAPGGAGAGDNLPGERAHSLPVTVPAGAALFVILGVGGG